MNVKFFRAFLNPPFVAGLVILVLGTVPMLVFSSDNIDLRLGLLFLVSIGPALALVGIGFVVALKQLDRRLW